MSKRVVYDNIEELKAAIRENPKLLDRKTPWIVDFYGIKKLALSGNSDQAIAAAGRATGVTVESIPLSCLFEESEPTPTLIIDGELK